MVLVLGVVRGAARALRGGRLPHDVRAAGPAAASDQRGDGRQLGLASASGEGVHGGVGAQPAPTAGVYCLCRGLYA